MQLTVKDVSELLNVSERTIYRWIKEQTIPVYHIRNQYRFSRSEILDWANSNRMTVSPKIFEEEAKTEETPLPSLYDSLKRGGIHYRVGGTDKRSVLRSVVDILNLPESVDREFLFKVLIEREQLGSTGIGEGIAIPHVRNPIILNVSSCVVALCFLERPVDFGAIDGKPVHALFTLVSTTARAHLYLLSRLMYMLKDPGFAGVVSNRSEREAILGETQRIENSFNKDLSGTP